MKKIRSAATRVGILLIPGKNFLCSNGTKVNEDYKI